MRIHIAAGLAACLLLEACSSRPREFTPQLAMTPADQAAFNQNVETCKELYVTGKLDSSGRLASGGAGAAAGAAVTVAGAAAASSAGIVAGAAVASATVIAIPFVVVGSAFGMARAKRHRKEKAVQKVMEGCLRERGYEVASWEKASKVKASE